MTIKEILDNLNKTLSLKNNVKSTAVFGKYSTILMCLIVIITLFIFFTLATENINNKVVSNKDATNVLENKSNFSKIINLFLRGLNDPYVETKYVIQNNDSLQKILWRFLICRYKFF